MLLSTIARDGVDKAMNYWRALVGNGVKIDDDGHVTPRAGWTERLVTPADPPRVVTGLVTGLWFLLHPAARRAPEPQPVAVP